MVRQLGLASEGASDLLDAQELARLDDAALREAVTHAAAFARVSPEDKLRLVTAYQQRGEVVAMLGDGVNDAAALRKADIGVVMGSRGSDLARESADLVLLDDRFPSIALAVAEGRVVFDNIRKFVFYLFSCNLAEVLVLLGAGFGGTLAPLTPLQILWLNLLTDTFPALALAVEPREPDIMRTPPRDPDEAILSWPAARTAIGYAVLISGVTLAAFFWALQREGAGTGQATTIAFMTLAFAQTLHLGNARSRKPVTSLRRALANRSAVLAVALALGLQILAVAWPPLAGVLRLHPLDPTAWAVVAALGAAPGVIGQALKWAREKSADRR
jgi:Ca2+-transporting ATPase